MTAFKEGFSEQVKSIKETTKSEKSESEKSELEKSELENSNVGSNGIIRVFAHDESRFGLMPITRRRITFAQFITVCSNLK